MINPNSETQVMRQTISSILPAHLRYLLLVYLLGLAAFTLPRLVLLVQHLDKVTDLPLTISLTALWMGFRFDTVISGYFLAIPFLLLTGLAVLPRAPRRGYLTTGVLLNLLYIVGFFAAWADVPYFNYFNSRLTVAALQWTDTPGFMAKMIFQDYHYYPYLLAFIFTAIIFSLVHWRIYRKYLSALPALTPPGGWKIWARFISVSLLAAALLFLGIRGRVAVKSPIRWGTAFFSPYPFPNQLGLNPVYTFFQSWLESRKPEQQRLHLMDDRQALALVQEYLQISPDSAFSSPLARLEIPPQATRRANLVLVLMENMAAAKMGLFGNPEQRTPHLDSLATHHSLFFRNFYSAGIHTYNGIYSTLFGLPALLNKHPMKSTESMQPFAGLISALKAHHYQTIFFATHDEQFDNMGGFLSFNGVDRVVSQKDYPAGEVRSTLGVPDHVMFREALPYLNKLGQSGQPFLAILLTASDHGPYVIPEDIPFHPRPGDIRRQIVEYADWALGYFMEMARRQPWYENTVFVFAADHGTNINPVYDLPLSYHHIPFIIHSPALIPENREFDKLGGQIDVYPTLMGFLGLPFVNTTLGMDLLHRKRSKIFFSADNKLGVLDEEFFYIWRRNGRESLYRYRDRDLTDYRDRFPERTEELRRYGLSMLQTAQVVIEKKWVAPQPLP